MSMRGSRESRSGAPNSSDLLVCFPSRAHLTLMPKTICSPARPPCEASKRHGHNHSLSLSTYNKNKSLLKRTRTRGGHGSPVLWAKTKSGMGKEMEMEMEEPTSPKVTCAGQIRVRPSKNWQSVMEEIERIHNKGRQKKKKPSWMEALGLKKDVMHFLTCLRTLRFDFSCFGSLPAGADITSDDEDDDDEDEEEEDHADNGGADEDEENSRAVFSKWFMVLQEEKEKEKNKDHDDDEVEGEGEEEACVPPPNALLLMRCRSAPAKSWLEERAEEEGEEKKCEHEEKEKENSVLMRYDTEYYKISSDIAKETWVVGGMGDVLARSRSCKR